MIARLAAAALVSLALAPASASASSKPHFPRYYSGTISGSISSVSDQGTARVRWTISGVRFKLVRARVAEGSWTGYYKITAGTVDFHASGAQGACAYAVDDKFSLRRAIPRPYPSTPFFMTRNMLGREYYDGIIEPSKTWEATQFCTSDDPNAPEPPPQRISAPNLFNTGEKRGRIGRALKGRFVTKDGSTESRTYRWSLRPRR